MGNALSTAALSRPYPYDSRLKAASLLPRKASLASDASRTRYIWEIPNYEQLLSFSPFDSRVAIRKSFSAAAQGDIPETCWDLYIQANQRCLDRYFDRAPKVHMHLSLNGNDEVETQEVFVAHRLEVLTNDGAVWRTIDFGDLEKVSNRFPHFIRCEDLPLLQNSSKGTPPFLQQDGSLHVRVTVMVTSGKRMRSRLPSTAFKYGATSNFASLLGKPDETFADVKIISKDRKEFKAHKLILMSRVPVFKAVLTSKMDGDGEKTGLIRLGLSAKAVEFLLRYIYAGDILPFVVNKDDPVKPCLSELVKGAHKYRFEDLLGYFDEAIGDICDKENSQFLLDLSTKFELKNAKKDVEKFIEANQELPEAGKLSSMSLS